MGLGRAERASLAWDRPWLREVAIGAAAAAAYFGGRVLVEGSETAAKFNAQRMLDLEAALRIDIEAAVQDFAVDNPVLRSLGNLSYVWLHWPLLLTVLVVLYRSAPPTYVRLRNTLCMSGAVGLVLFALYPESPPRFLEDYVGTVSDAARRHYLSYPLSWTNRFASFPSFHVGWTLVACLALESTIRQSWRVAALVPAVLVAVAVVSTGNHYVLDAVAGTVIPVAIYVRLGRESPRLRV